MYQETIWRSSAAAFSTVVAAGIPAVATLAEVTDMSDAWAAAADAFEGFLLGADLQCSSSSSTDPAAGPQKAPARGAGRESVGSEAGMVIGDSGHGSSSSSRLPSQEEEATSAAPRESGQQHAPPAAAAANAGATQPAQQAVDAQRAQADAELEAAVLDTLTDCVLTQCAAAPATAKLRFIQAVDRGIIRPRALAIPHVRGCPLLLVML